MTQQIENLLVPFGSCDRYKAFTFVKEDEQYNLSIQPPNMGMHPPDPKTLTRFEVACWKKTDRDAPYEFPDFVIQTMGTRMGQCPIVCVKEEAQAIFDLFMDWGSLWDTGE